MEADVTYKFPDASTAMLFGVVTVASVRTSPSEVTLRMASLYKSVTYSMPDESKHTETSVSKRAFVPIALIKPL